MMMKPLAGTLSTLSSSVAALILASLVSGCGGSATSVAPLPQTDLNSTGPTTAQSTINLTAAELADHATYTDLRYHVNPVKLAGNVHRLDVAGTVRRMSVIFPADMSKGAGKVLTATTYSDIFINTTAAAVGTPSTFQTNFNNSTFIGVLNQYDGVTSTGKFPVSATTFTAAVPVFTNMISQDDMLNVIHAAAKIGGTGYGHEYIAFLEKGLDHCFDFGPCYSPDNPGSWVFCAYHSSVTYTDIGHVVFEVVPYSDVAAGNFFCGDDNPGLIPHEPNPAPVDSFADEMSHETSESISDPDPNTGWFNATFGMEIGDVCNSFRATENLNAHNYLIQPEYSNTLHGCFF